MELPKIFVWNTFKKHFNIMMAYTTWVRKHQCGLLLRRAGRLQQEVLRLDQHSRQRQKEEHVACYSFMAKTKQYFVLLKPKNDMQLTRSNICFLLNVFKECRMS